MLGEPQETTVTPTDPEILDSDVPGGRVHVLIHNPTTEDIDEGWRTPLGPLSNGRVTVGLPTHRAGARS